MKVEVQSRHHSVKEHSNVGDVLDKLRTYGGGGVIDSDGLTFGENTKAKNKNKDPHYTQTHQLRLHFVTKKTEFSINHR